MSPPRDTACTTSSSDTAATNAGDIRSEGHQQPQEEQSNNNNNNKQYLFLIRHGDRWDYQNPQWNNKDTSRIGDSPLSKLGIQQARETGTFLNSVLTKEGIISSSDSSSNNITWLSSPFLRCLQTSQEAINQLSECSEDIPIKPEYSVFEWDGKGGKWHESLPSIEERIHYFPTLDLQYESMFVPEIPEPRSKFHSRCEKAVNCINARFTYQPNQAIVVVTHAAGCIGLSRAATRLELENIQPAGPCAVYMLTRTSNTDTWTIDEHDVSQSMNGHVDHLSDLGTKTVPWNNFYDKSHHHGYSGPPTSKFAPQSLIDEMN